MKCVHVIVCAMGGVERRMVMCGCREDGDVRV